MKINWKVPVILVALAGLGTWLALDHRTWGRVVGVWRQLSPSSGHESESRPDKSWLSSSSSSGAKAPWDHVLTLTESQVKGLGLKTTTVKEQSEPSILPLAGATDYDPATLTIVRTQFDSRVDKVLVDLGTLVKQGDPLLELFSADLAESKSNYEAALNQWTRDKKVLDYRAPLAQTSAIPRKELIEIENDEAQSRLRMKLAKDKLLVYGLTDKEIEDAKTEDGVQKAKMTLRSRADGIVIKRSVVRGNYYDSKDELMQIAPLDHLWVRGNVSELDADKVEIGQNLKVIFPHSDLTIPAKVEYIDKAIDPETRSAKFRTSIGNPGRRLKAGMFVKVQVEIPPKPGRTVIPRSAMVSVDRIDYTFVKKSKTGARFERRPILVAKESNDQVIVREHSPDHLGLKPGEEVVSTGSLILQQLYEDRMMVEGESHAPESAGGGGGPSGHKSVVIVTKP